MFFPGWNTCFSHEHGNQWMLTQKSGGLCWLSAFAFLAPPSTFFIYFCPGYAALWTATMGTLIFCLPVEFKTVQCGERVPSHHWGLPHWAPGSEVATHFSGSFCAVVSLKTAVSFIRFSGPSLQWPLLWPLGNLEFLLLLVLEYLTILCHFPYPCSC